MKKLFFGVLMAIIASAPVFAEEAKNDTIKVDYAKISEVVEHPTTTAKGKPTTRYYFVYEGQLVSTSKKVVESYKLAQQYNAKVALYVVTNRDTKRKRIVSE